jgi:hypothetical protein
MSKIGRMARVVLVACCLAAAAAPTAQADGGANIAAAPTITLAEHLSGGAANVDSYAICCSEWQHPDSPGVQYWRVDLALGDQLTLDYENVTGEGTGVCMLAPETTDYTVAETDCSHSDGTDAKDQMRFTAPTAGSWILSVYVNWCCQRGPWAYDFVGSVRRRTTLTLSAPTTARAGNKVLLTGRVAPGLAAPVTVQRKLAGRWRTFGTATAAADGAFTLKARLARPGGYRLRAVYAGDAQYLPSQSRQVKVKARR